MPIIPTNFPRCPRCEQHFVGSECPKCGHDPKNPLKTTISLPEPICDNKTSPEPFAGPEKHLHADFITDMNRRGAHCIHARTDQASTIGRGYPDVHVMFTAADGITRGCAIEFKVKGNKPSPAQLDCIETINRKGIPVTVCYDLAGAISFAKHHLCMPDEA